MTGATSGRTGLKNRRLTLRRDETMQVVKIVVWQQDETWLGYIQDYPDYWTQGESLDDLKEHLNDLYTDLSAGLIPGTRSVKDLIVS